MQEVQIIRWDDGEFAIQSDGVIVGNILTNMQAREARRQMEEGTFSLHDWTALPRAGVV